MDYLKFLSFLKNDFVISNSKYQSVSFFRSDLILIIIWFYVLEKHYKGQSYSSEDLISEIPRKYASRPTVFKFINLAIKKKYLLKIKNEKDKRKFDLKPTNNTIDEFQKWSVGFRGF